MTMTHALDMPEIRDAIILHLPCRNDLLACILISHAWKASAQPWLWRHIFLYSVLQPTRIPQTKAPFPNANLQNPPAALFHQNTRFVRQLHVKAPIDPQLLMLLGNINGEAEDLALRFPALEELHVHGYCCDETVIDLEIRFASRLIRHALGHTGTLKGLHLSSLPPGSVTTLLQALRDDSYPSFNTTVTVATSPYRTKKALNRLSLADLTLPYNSTERALFWRHCTTVRRRLEFDTVNCLNYACPPELAFPHIQHLQLTNMALFSPFDEIQLMSQCPKLTSLEWRPSTSSSTTAPSNLFFNPSPTIPLPPPQQQPHQYQYQTTTQTCSPFPKLHTLTLRGSQISDSSLAFVLSGCERPIQKLDVSGTGFGQESLDMLLMLGQHCHSLREIDMGGCKNVTSPMVARILDQCPLLEVLVAPTLKVCDVMASSSACTRREWACKDLRRLEVQIEIETSMLDLERPFILARFASMPKLTKIGVPLPSS